jgi:hypothetical protein
MKVPKFLFNQDCTISPFTGDTPSGPGYGTSFASKCRCEKHKKKYISSLGVEYVSEAIIFLPANASTKALEVDSKFNVLGKDRILMDIILHRGLEDSHLEGILK